MSLRILHVTPYFAGAWAYGGIPRVATTLTRELSRRGHQVTVYTTDVCTREQRLAHAQASEVDGVRVRTFPNRSNRLAYDLQFFTPRGLGSAVRRHVGEFDIAHIHAHRHMLEAVTARALRRAKVPYVAAPNGTAPRIERRVLAKQVWDLACGTRDLAGAAAVLAVSAAERRDLEQIGVAPHRIRHVPNPLDLDEFAVPPRRGAFRAAWDLGYAPVVLFLGKLTPRKRVDVLVAAMARVRTPGARLVIAGNDMGVGSALRQQAAAYGLEHQTVFTGLLSGVARLEALADADVVVYPSAREVFGLVPLEALLCGTPVVVADDSGCGEVISTLEGGQVMPLADEIALAAAITRVLDARHAWRELAARGGAACRSKFSGAVVAEQLDGLYHELLAR